MSEGDYQSAVSAASSALPETVCGRDERVRVDPETSPPYNWICNILITAANGVRYVGSGFKIHVPNLNRTIVVTSGHNVWIGGAYASSIRVTFPGEPPVTVDDSANMYASPEYRNSLNADFDYGMISLGGDSNEGFGWSGLIPDDELLVDRVTNCGYPYDKRPWPQMWITGGKVNEVTTHRLFYMNDTYSGQSGSPVYLWYKGHWTVVAVHSYGGCPNSAPRFSSQMIYRFLEHINSLKKYALRSATFVHVYIRCDGDGVTEYESNGGGSINCQYMPPSDWETFYMYPVEVTPSLAQEQAQVVVLQNVHWTNAFVRMDGSDITEFESPGGGVVNCQYSGVFATRWEAFILKEDDQQNYSFQSEEFPHRYIRLDGSEVTSYSSSGGGVVNCQYCRYASDVSNWEKFTLVEQD